MRIVKAHPLKLYQLGIRQLFPFSHADAVSLSCLQTFEYLCPPKIFKVALRVAYVPNLSDNPPGLAGMASVSAPKESPIWRNPSEFCFRLLLYRNIDGLVCVLRRWLGPVYLDVYKRQITS